MTREELLKILIDIKKLQGPEADKFWRGDFMDHHIAADKALLLFINDLEIKEAFEDIEKWYG